MTAAPREPKVRQLLNLNIRSKNVDVAEYRCLLVSDDPYDRRAITHLLVEKLRQPRPFFISPGMEGLYLEKLLPLHFIFVRFDSRTTESKLEEIERVCSPIEAGLRPKILVLCTRDNLGAAQSTLKLVEHERRGVLITPFDEKTVAQTMNIAIERTENQDSETGQ